MKKLLILMVIFAVMGCSNPSNNRQPPPPGENMPSMQETMKSIQIRQDISRNKKISDNDLEWVLNFINRAPRGTREASMVFLRHLNRAPQSQKDKIKASLSPYLNSSIPSEKKAAERVIQAMS